VGGDRHAEDTDDHECWKHDRELPEIPRSSEHHRERDEDPGEEDQQEEVGAEPS